MASLVIGAVLVSSASDKSTQRRRIDPEKGCQANPEVVGECFEVHARVFLANGTPGLRMWPVGTDRYFGVIPSEDEIVPENVRKHIGLGKQIYGDFLVCPFTVERAGWMRMVCIQKASSLVIEEYTDVDQPPRLYFDNSVEEVAK